jgi:hypothetical protein
MDDVLQQLSRIPGVVGALACGPRGELLASSFPPLFDELALHQAASLFSDDTAGLRTLAGPEGALDVRYARGRAVAKPFAQGTIVVVGTPAVDAMLLGLALEQAARRLESAPRPAAGSASPAGPTPLPQGVAALRDPLQEALVRSIGPFGEVVFAEAWNAWARAAPPPRARLEALLTELAREVDGDAERARFLAEARGVIR